MVLHMCQQLCKRCYDSEVVMEHFAASVLNHVLPVLNHALLVLNHTLPVLHIGPAHKISADFFSISS